MGILLSIFTGLSTASSFFTGLFGTLNGITSAISNAQIAKINATSAEEVARIQETLNTLQARRDVMIAESAHSNLNGIMRFTIAVGPAVYLCKIFLWDKVVGAIFGCTVVGAAGCSSFNTDALDANLWNVVMVVLGFYFLYDASTTITRIWGAIKK